MEIYLLKMLRMLGNLSPNNWLRIKLKGSTKNPLGIGAKVTIYVDSLGMQTNDFTLTRGYLSSVEPYLHFGLANKNTIDSVVVDWQNGQREKLTNISANQLLEIDQKSANSTSTNLAKAKNKKVLFEEISEQLGINFIQKEQDYIDFNVQPMLPHKLSQYGPSLAVGDVNSDGLEDVFIGGSHFQKGTFLVQQSNGTFEEQDLIQYTDKDAYKSEELGAILFDADQDGDDDLYVVHGGYEFDLMDSQYVDRIYTNENGQYLWTPSALPEILSSGLNVKAADYDKDGDLDLFVGGRVNPAKYPSPVSSYILKNESSANGIRFVDVTKEVAPMLENIGMISDALWSDFNNDGWIDLVLAGEFMPIMFCENQNGKLKIENSKLKIENSSGWWNSLIGGDFDNDGDIDYLAGNTGRNTTTDISTNHPIKVYYKDFDNNGTGDLFPTCYFPDQNGEMKEFPYFGRLEIAKQYNVIPRKFPFHKELAVATIHDIFNAEEMEGALILAANNFNTSYVENLGDGNFSIKPLPKLVQRSPIYGMQTADVNQDGHLDVLMVGNDYGMEVSVGRMDAHDGLVAFGDGQGNFEVKGATETGFLVPANAKSLVRLQVFNGKTIYLAGQNRAPLKVYSDNIPTHTIPLSDDDVYAILKLKNGGTRKAEFYYGSSFLSQSSRTLLVDETMEEVMIYDVQGNRRAGIDKGLSGR